METQTRSDVLARLPYDSFYEALHKVRLTLPPPLEETPEAYARRDRAVVNQIKQLVPASAIEAEFAARCVAAGEFAMGCLREARELGQDHRHQRDRLIAQAVRMGREARGHLASLLRVQATRTRREKTEAGAYRADAIEDGAGGMLLDALADPPGGTAAVPPRATASAAERGPPVLARLRAAMAQMAEAAAHQAEAAAPRADPAPPRADAATLRADPATLRADAAPLRANPTPHRADPATPRADAATLRADPTMPRADPATLRAAAAPHRADPATPRADAATLRADAAPHRADPTMPRVDVAIPRANPTPPRAEAAIPRANAASPPPQPASAPVPASGAVRHPSPQPDQFAPAAPQPAHRADAAPSRPEAPPRIFHQPATRRGRSRDQARDDGWPLFDPAKEAEQYAIHYPNRARLIRRLGGLPANCSFGPPEPELVRAIVAGTSPALRALDGVAA